VPAGHGPIEPRRLDVIREQQELEAVCQGHLREFGGRRLGKHEVAPLERTVELRVGGALRGHEHMFAFKSKLRQAPAAASGGFCRGLRLAPRCGCWVPLGG
jgi:hypothetical protein